MIRFLFAVVLTLIVTGCSLTPPEGQLECNNNDACPENWICHTDHRCYSSEDVIPDSSADTDTDTDSDTNTETITDDGATDTNADTNSDTSTDTGSSS